MANFLQLPYPAWLKEIINPRERASVNGSGFQGAHQIGDKFWSSPEVDFTADAANRKWAGDVSYIILR